jgi:hypothetical protein
VASAARKMLGVNLGSLADCQYVVALVMAEDREAVSPARICGGSRAPGSVAP